MTTSPPPRERRANHSQAFIQWTPTPSCLTSAASASSPSSFLSSRSAPTATNTTTKFIFHRQTSFLPLSSISTCRSTSCPSPISHNATVTAELTQDDTAKQAESRMSKTIDSVKASFNTVRTGRANPSLLDRVMVSYYGAETPLNQIASVSVSGTSTLLVESYDKGAVPDIERALLEADLGLTPQSDGQSIRLAVPALTQERRVELVKQVKAMAEDGRVALRNIRRDAVDSVKKLEKKKTLGKDESKTIQDEIQKLTDKYVTQIDSLYKQKDADIMKV